MSDHNEKVLTDALHMGKRNMYYVNVSLDGKHTIATAEDGSQRHTMGYWAEHGQPGGYMIPVECVKEATAGTESIKKAIAVLRDGARTGKGLDETIDAAAKVAVNGLMDRLGVDKADTAVSNDWAKQDRAPRRPTGIRQEFASPYGHGLQENQTNLPGTEVSEEEFAKLPKELREIVEGLKKSGAKISVRRVD